MRTKLKIFTLILLLLFTGFTPDNKKKNNDALTQYSTIDALLSGIYDGEITLQELKPFGDFGLGTFNGLDGEMIVLNGKFYKVPADGKAVEPELNTKTPFAAVKFFKTDKKYDLHSGVTFDSLEKIIDNIIPTKNIFYAVKITGRFNSITTRSFPKQSKPYKPLKELAGLQHVFDFKNTDGTIVGFRCPSYVSGVNVSCYHFHFLTKDYKGGGHVLRLEIKNAVLEIDESSDFSLKLPNVKEFYDADLTIDKQAELKKIEK